MLHGFVVRQLLKHVMTGCMHCRMSYYSLRNPWSNKPYGSGLRLCWKMWHLTATKIQFNPSLKNKGFSGVFNVSCRKWNDYMLLVTWLLRNRSKSKITFSFKAVHLILTDPDCSWCYRSDQRGQIKQILLTLSWRKFCDFQCFISA